MAAGHLHREQAQRCGPEGSTQIESCRCCLRWSLRAANPLSALWLGVPQMIDKAPKEMMEELHMLLCIPDAAETSSSGGSRMGTSLPAGLLAHQIFPINPRWLKPSRQSQDSPLEFLRWATGCVSLRWLLGTALTLLKPLRMRMNRCGGNSHH
ncbi:uncharacterized protein O3Q21_010292 [Podargus strigoides]